MTLTKTIFFTTVIVSLFSNTAFGGDRAVNGLIIGGGSGALMGQAIGRNSESTIIGATVGGILGYIIGNETRSHVGRGYRPAPAYPVYEYYDHRYRPELTKKKYRKYHRPSKSRGNRPTFVRKHGSRRHFPHGDTSYGRKYPVPRQNYDRFYR